MTSTLTLFNTETRKKEALTPLNGKEVSLYTCGPTVYHFAHIGNFRAYIFEDLLKRTIRFFGMPVNHVMNITDVDDKTIKGAIAKNTTLNAFTEPYKKAFFEDIKTLNIDPADTYPCATDYIPQMRDMIQTLIDKGIAYTSKDGSVYYSIQKFPRYGCLSHLNLDELKSGASDRVHSDEYDKENVSDFVLWKAYDEKRDGQIFWESPWGKGRPGWHLECSVMAIELLGETIDLHIGGVDNMFPHHENEIAQSEACTEKTFARHWMHCEHLIVDGKKMSKSLGNFYTIRDVLDKGFSGQEIRYMLLHSHYRAQLNFTWEEMSAIRVSLHRLNDFVLRLQNIEGDDSEQHKKAIEKAESKFTDSLADDLNISAALASLFDFVREINALCDQSKVGSNDALDILSFLKKIDSVLGVFTFEQQPPSIPDDVQKAFDRRLEARKQKDWSLADELRDEILAKGWVIEDTPQGARLKKA